MDMEKLRRAGLAFVVAAVGTLLWLTGRGNEQPSQLSEIGGLAMLAGGLIGLALLAGAMIGKRPSESDTR
jgi:hypothetical protein